MSSATEIFGKSYMTHDFDAGCDEKCEELMDRDDGVEQYGRLWLMFEAFGRSSNGELDVSTDRKRRVAMRLLHCEDDAALQTYMDAVDECGLIEHERYERGVLASESWMNRQTWLKSKSDAGRKGSEKRWGAKDG